MPLSSVADVCVSVKCGSDVSLSVAQKCAQRCRSEVSLKSVAHKRRLYMCARVCSEVLLGSADQKHRSGMLLRTVGQRCRSEGVDQPEVSLKCVAQKCQSKVLLRSVAQKSSARWKIASL